MDQAQQIGPLSTQVMAPRLLLRLWRSLSRHKIPLVGLFLFLFLALKSLYPDLMSLNSGRSRAYRFRVNSLGFFVGDFSTINSSTSSEEAESKVIALFPEKLQAKVQSVVRPVLFLCEKYQVDPFWVLSVMWTESNFKINATSHKGADGLMQIMPETYMELVAQMEKEGMILESSRGPDYLRTVYPEAFQQMGAEHLTKKLQNLEVGIFYLKHLLSGFNYNFVHATVAYNMGPNWTKFRLNNNLPVGKDNQYLNKVLKAYFHITKNINHSANVSFVSVND